VASRVCITGLTLNARCGIADFSLRGEDMLKSNVRGLAFAERSESGDDRGGVYAE
jgi:hypothetical protein